MLTFTQLWFINMYYDYVIFIQYNITMHQNLSLTDGNVNSFMSPALCKMLCYSSCTVSHTVKSKGWSRLLISIFIKKWLLVKPLFYFLGRSTLVSFMVL